MQRCGCCSRPPGQVHPDAVFLPARQGFVTADQDNKPCDQNNVCHHGKKSCDHHNVGCADTSNENRYQNAAGENLAEFPFVFYQVI